MPTPTAMAAECQIRGAAHIAIDLHSTRELPAADDCSYPFDRCIRLQLDRRIDLNISIVVCARVVIARQHMGRDARQIIADGLHHDLTAGGILGQILVRHPELRRGAVRADRPIVDVEHVRPDAERIAVEVLGAERQIVR